MKRNKQLLTLKLLAFLMCTIVNLGFAQAQTPVSKNGQLKVVGLKLCNQYGNPIQLRGMSTHGIQWYGWGSCLTEASLDALAYDWGSDVLRISLYVQEGGYETNPTAFTNQVTTLINEATERGMYALVDWHQLTPGDPNANLTNAKKFFTDICTLHKDKNNIIYDICNEPNGVAWSRIKTYSDQIIPVIRAIDGDAVVLVGTHAWGSMGISDGRTAQDIVSNPVNFSNIMYTFHFYAKDHRDEYLNELDWASDRLPVFVTEFGTQEASGDGPNDFAMAQRYIDLMRNKKISWTNWNYSDDSRSGAVWTTGTCSNGPWNTSRLKPAGTQVRSWMLSPADDFPGGGNVAPTVSITAPSSGSSFVAPASITINATAADNDGSVSKVEFFNGATKLGEDLTAPYSFSWTNVAAGSYTITAKATDNIGASTTSSSVSISVTVSVIQTPFSGTPIALPGKVEAENYDKGGQAIAFNESTTANQGGQYRTTEAVDIEVSTDGGYNVGYITAGEWLEYTVNVATAGSYKVDARIATIATGKSFRIELDGVNLGTFSLPNTGGWQNWQTVTLNNVAFSAGQKVLRVFAVSADFNLNYINVLTTTTNVVPTVSITAPLNNAVFNAPATIVINANAADADGTISKVEFFNGSTKLGEDVSAPYSFTWNDVAGGNYTIAAKATDNLSAVSNLASVSITVNAGVNNPPIVSITSPVNGSVYLAPAAVTISANASDDGSVTKVEFFNGAIKLGEDLSSPYSFTWSNLSAGAYNLTAKATDNLGLSTISGVVSITVTPSTDVCGSVAQYVENNGYVAGSNVKNSGKRYECKPWPFSGWCNGAAWAYAPGTGAYWADAWVEKGTCTARVGSFNEVELVNNPLVEISPNPTTGAAFLNLIGITAAEVEVVDLYGTIAIVTKLVGAGETIDFTSLPAGLYFVKVKYDDKSITKRIVKK